MDDARRAFPVRAVVVVECKEEVEAVVLSEEDAEATLGRPKL